MENILINSNILNKYLKNNHRQIYHNFSNKKTILKDWIKKLKNPNKSENFFHEERNYKEGFYYCP